MAQSAKIAAMLSRRKKRKVAREETQIDERWGFGSKKKSSEPSDQFAAMHHMLTKYGYQRTEKTNAKKKYVYTHKSGDYRAHLHMSSISDGVFKPGCPQCVHSTGGRYHTANELEKHLSAVHGVKEETEMKYINERAVEVSKTVYDSEDDEGSLPKEKKIKAKKPKNDGVDVTKEERSSLSKLQKIDEGSDELDEAYRVHVTYDDPTNKRTGQNARASVRVRIRAKTPAHAKAQALKRLQSWPNDISGYQNAKVHRVVKEEAEQIDELHGKGDLERIRNYHNHKYDERSAKASSRIAKYAPAGSEDWTDIKDVKTRYKVGRKLERDVHKLTKHDNAVDRARNLIKMRDRKALRKEEMEMLDEEIHIDKMTRHEKIAYHGLMRDHHSSLASQADAYGANSDADHWHKMASLHRHKAASHSTVLAGLKAKKKMYEEVEGLDELSVKKIDAYRKKAHDERSASNNPTERKDKNRHKGVHLAFDKLTGRAKINAKEEYEQIDERRQRPARYDGDDDRDDQKSARAQKLARDKAKRRREVEEETLVTEISQKLARNYAVGAAADLVKRNTKAVHDDNSGRTDRMSKDQIDKLDKKFDSRFKGLGRANKRLGSGAQVYPKF